ncbi:MAG: inverse autotransporter beta domain-containing protein, partial [Cyanobacteriota bacterium]
MGLEPKQILAKKMLLRTSTPCIYTILLLLGTLTSTAVAQTTESKPNPSSATTDFTGVTIVQFPDGIAELNNNTVEASLGDTLDVTEHPQGASEPKTLSFENQNSLAKPSFYTLKEGRFITQISNVETALFTPKSSPKNVPSSETLKVEVSQPLVEVKTPPRTLHEAGLVQETITPENVSSITEISADTKQILQSDRVRFQRFLPRIGAEFTTGSSVGYESSFGSIEGFVPLWQNLDNLTFLEGRLLLSTEDSHTSSNIVLGHRFYSAKDNRILGGYVAFDTRDTGNSNFNQLGAGFESLGENWDVRANAYIPVGDTRQLTQERVFSTGLSFSDPFFQGNFLGQTRNQQLQRDRNFEAAMAGFDVEAGVKIAQLGQTGDLRGYAGLYYYDAPGSAEILGWRTRLEARPTDTFRLGLLLSNDATFGTNLVLSVGANFPGTRPRGIRKEDRVLARLGESVTRNANIIVDEQSESESFSVQDTVFVTNPATGQPWRFRHVNLGIGTGNGTFENPTATVAEALAVAQPNDIVYVQP